MLVSAKEMLDKAKAGKYAVGHFNINNLEWTKAILLTAQENNSPVILGVSEGAGKYMGGYTTVVGMVNGMIKELGITVPVALHLDHGSYEAAKECIEKGFSSVMFDGSKYDIEENVAKTKEIVALAHAKGVSVEAEVGAIGGEEDGVLGGGEIADPDECASICELGVDMLAAGIGNIHGVYPENWPGLRLDVLAKIQEKTGTMPLVLHGGTGIPDEMVKDAISKGVSKINVNTECSSQRASTQERSSSRASRPSRKRSRKRWSCSARSTKHKSFVSLYVCGRRALPSPAFCHKEVSVLQYQPQNIRLRDGRTALFRQPAPQDAAGMIAYMKTCYGESPYLLHTPEDFVMTVEKEETFLARILDSEYNLMIVCEIGGEIAGNCQLSFHNNRQLPALLPQQAQDPPPCRCRHRAGTEVLGPWDRLRHV